MSLAGCMLPLRACLHTRAAKGVRGQFNYGVQDEAEKVTLSTSHFHMVLPLLDTEQSHNTKRPFLMSVGTPMAVTYKLTCETHSLWCWS